jgi:hypothetical protein
MVVLVDRRALASEECRGGRMVGSVVDMLGSPCAGGQIRLRKWVGAGVRGGDVRYGCTRLSLRGLRVCQELDVLL